MARCPVLRPVHKFEISLINCWRQGRGWAREPHVPTKILTLRYSPKLGEFDEAPLLALSQGHEILTLREHFFVFQDIPQLHARRQLEQRC